MGVLLAPISLSVVLSAGTTGACAIFVADLPGYKKQRLSWHADDQHDICVSFATSSEQAFDIEPEARVYGTGCSRQRVQHGGIVVDQWYGRVGNNLYQIAHAIFAAKVSGNLQVNLPREWSFHDGSIRTLFNVPGVFDVNEDEEFRARVHCENSSDSHFFLYKCSGVKRSDYTSVLRTYVLPHLVDGARGACQKEEANTKLELVIHLRAGDLLSEKDPNDRKARFAPCSLLDKILADPLSGSFERIRAITEPDLMHPCLSKFEAEGVEVQSKSVVADACAFMHAQHLGFFAKSSFSDALSLFNPNPVTLYDPTGGPIGCRKHGANKECPHGQAIKYCIPGHRSTSLEDKVNWVRQFSSNHISRGGLQCFE